MSVVETTVNLIGDEALCNIFLSRTIPEGCPTDIYDNAVESLRGMAIYGFSGLHSLYFDALKGISQESIMNCPDLVRIEAPMATYVQLNGVQNNPNLEEVILPKVTSIGKQGFHNNKSIKHLSFPVCTSLGDGAFYRCEGVLSAEFPRLQSIGANAIGSCVQLQQLDLPSVKTIQSDLLATDSAVTIVNIGPGITSIDTAAFKKTSDDLVINLAVSEGVVSGAPWGATGATINYDVPYSGTVPMPED